MTPPVPPSPGFNNPHDRRRRLGDIQQVVDSLRAEVPVPDLTEQILARVAAERPFTDRRTRAWVVASRYAAAASIAIVALGVAMVHRFAPGVTTLVSDPQPQPFSRVVEVAQSSAAAGYNTFLATCEQVGGGGRNASALALPVASVQGGTVEVDGNGGGVGGGGGGLIVAGGQTPQNRGRIVPIARFGKTVAPAAIASSNIIDPVTAFAPADLAVAIPIDPALTEQGGGAGGVRGIAGLRAGRSALLIDGAPQRPALVPITTYRPAPRRRDVIILDDAILPIPGHSDGGAAIPR